MLKNVLITGDTHGRLEGRLAYIQQNMPEYIPAETAVIVLGDVGLNYYKSKHDWKNKLRVSKFGYTIYCLRGNHEDRISNCPKAHRIYDEFSDTFVWIEDQFPLIKYFDDDVGEATFNGHTVLTIPGAYSVDKWYRLMMDMQWFVDEQLTEEEMKLGSSFAKDRNFDLVFSHTCPLDFTPEDLFLSCVDQSKVDKSMEVWMNELKHTFSWGIWLFGHFHADRIEAPYVEQFYQEVEDLESVIARWEQFKVTGDLDWWLPKSPMMKDFLAEKIEEDKINEA